MNPLRAFLALLCFTASVLAFGGSQTTLPPEQNDVGLRPDGRIMLKPTESITLKFDVKDGKLSKPTVIPHPEFPQTPQPNTVTFWLVRTGGDRTVLGVPRPLQDALSIKSTLPGPITLRYAYWLPGEREPGKPRFLPLTDKGRDFKIPIARVIITEIELKEVQPKRK